MNPLKYFLLLRHYISSLNLVLLVTILDVHKMYVLVLTVLKQLERLVLHILTTNARLVIVTIIKRFLTHDMFRELAVPVWFVELGKDKRLLVLRELIVYVHKMYVLVLTVLKQLERLVLHIMVISARLVLVTIIKRVIILAVRKLLVQKLMVFLQVHLYVLEVQVLKVTRDQLSVVLHHVLLIQMLQKMLDVAIKLLVP